MRSPLKALLVTGSLAAAILGAAVPAAVAAASAVAHPKPSPSPSPTPSSSPSPSPTPSSSSAAPTLVTSNFACANGVCEVGPGNVGMSFAAGMFGTDGPTCSPGSACNGNNFLMSVVSGSLPPGLQLDEQFNVNYWTIWGTPKKAGTYTFTVQVTPWDNNAGGIVGPSSTQQLTITVGTGSSDRPANMGAGWNGHTETLGIQGYDANISALWSVTLLGGKKPVVLISNQPSRTTYPIDGFLVVQAHTGYPCPTFNGCGLTVTNNLGSSVTVHLGPPSY